MGRELAKQLDLAARTAYKRSTFHALLGDGSGNVLAYDPDGAVIPGHVVARIQFSDETASTVRQVRCDKIAPVYGLPVIIGYGRDGNFEVVETDPSTALAFTNGRSAQVGNHGWMHSLLGPDPLFLDGLQFKPFLTQPNSPPDLNVRVRSTHYVFDATNKLSPSGATGLVDLSSYLPANPSEQRIAVISLNPSTNAFAVNASTAVVPPTAPGADSMPFTDTDVKAVSTTTTNWRLAAVRLYNGQTQILWSDFIADLRQWIADNAAIIEPIARGGTGSDLSGTGPGFLQQASIGAVVTILKHKLNATANPTTSDDVSAGYAVGSLWINVTGDSVWQCVDATASAAVWHQTDATGGSGSAIDLVTWSNW